MSWKPMDEGEFWKLFKDSERYFVKNLFVFCSKCNELVVDYETLWKIAEEKEKLWKQQGVWNKYSGHLAPASIRCPKCGTTNYITLSFIRYPAGNCWRAKLILLQAKTVEEIDDVVKKIETIFSRI